MAYPIFSIMLSLFLLPCFLIGSEKQIDKAEQDKRNANAEIYREIAAALGAHIEDKTNKTNNTPTNSPSLIKALQEEKKAKL